MDKNTRDYYIGKGVEAEVRRYRKESLKECRKAGIALMEAYCAMLSIKAVLPMEGLAATRMNSPP